MQSSVKYPNKLLTSLLSLTKAKSHFLFSIRSVVKHYHQQMSLYYSLHMCCLSLLWEIFRALVVVAISALNASVLHLSPSNHYRTIELKKLILK